MRTGRARRFLRRLPRRRRAVSAAPHEEHGHARRGRAAASGVPVLFVWGGGDGATAARKAAEESAGAAGAHGSRWRSVAFGDADEHFAFFRESEVKNDADDADARVVDAANEIVQWMFRE